MVDKMADPYRVLGVPPDAGNDELKAAYRELAHKYHPDKYEGNPLSDLAEDKMREINAAYDEIMESRKAGQQGNGYNRAGNYGSSYSSSQFSDIRRLINARRVTEAEELLDGVPENSRDAEWYFLKGSVQYTRGWLDEAFENFSRACAMDPSNQEYAGAYNQLQWQRRTGRPAGSGYRTGGKAAGYDCTPCDICTALYCTDCCCQCMGGSRLCC